METNVVYGTYSGGSAAFRGSEALELTPATGQHTQEYKRENHKEKA